MTRRVLRAGLWEISHSFTSLLHEKSRVKEEQEFNLRRYWEWKLEWEEIEETGRQLGAEVWNIELGV